MRAAQDLSAQQYQANQRNKVLLDTVREMCNQKNIRKIARESGIDPANLSHVLNGKRELTAFMQAKLEPLWVSTNHSSTL